MQKTLCGRLIWLCFIVLDATIPLNCTFIFQTWLVVFRHRYDSQPLTLVSSSFGAVALSLVENYFRTKIWREEGYALGLHFSWSVDIGELDRVLL